MIKYSVIVPTCHKDLTEMFLANFVKLNSPEEDFELIIVKNATNEDIQSVVDKYSDKIKNLKMIESLAGSTEARHCGVKVSQGEILCFTDDDCLLDKNWLVEIENSFLLPEVVCVTGNNFPKYEGEVPNWLKYFWVKNKMGKFMFELSFVDFGDKPKKIPAWFVFGLNFIIKKDIFLECLGFNPDIYPKEKWAYQGDAETALALRMNQKGYVAYFNPNLKLQHVTPESRTTVEYFKKRGYFQGVSDSFSQIRDKNGLMKFSYKPNKNVDLEYVKKDFFLKRKFEKIILPIFKRILDKDYSEYLKIKKEYAKSRIEGKNFHQKEFENDKNLQTWVLKENYLDSFN